MIEKWKDIKGYEGCYQISTNGNVRSLDRFVNSNPKNNKRFVKGQPIKKIKDKDGYLKVSLKKNQKGRKFFIHRLIALAFIPNNKNKPQVNHINGIKDDNSILNLEWCTMSENRRHSYYNGLQNGKSRRGVKSNFNKLSEKQIIEIRKRYKNEKIYQKDLAKDYNVTQSCISFIINKRNWNWI